MHTVLGYFFMVNSSPPVQNGRDFADDIFSSVNEMFFVLIKSSLKFVPKDPIDNNQALV